MDVNAAGHGWFVDVSSSASDQFRMGLDRNMLAAIAGSDAYGRMDLLSVIAHEMGHVLGFDHDDADRFAVMGDELDPGVRYLLDEIGFDGDPDQPISDLSLLQMAKRAAALEESMASNQTGKQPAAFDWGAGSGVEGSSVDWQAQSGSGWETSYSPFNQGKTDKGAVGNFSDFLVKLVKGSDGNTGFDKMGNELNGKAAKSTGQNARL